MNPDPPAVGIVDEEGKHDWAEEASKDVFFKEV